MTQNSESCVECGDIYYPIDERFNICWACLPCYCGEGCGFSWSQGYLGLKTCETQIDQVELDKNLENIKNGLNEK